jgi:hypothetical protein
MRIDQRNAGVAVATSAAAATYTLDRFFYYASQAAKFTVQQDSSANTIAGFTSSLKVVSTSSYTVTSNEIFHISQHLEGLNTSDLAWGTASAKSVTLSFFVRSSLTGTFGGALRNDNSDRSYPFSYTIVAANTWEQKFITIPGDTTGTWFTTNGTGMYVYFSFGAGSSFVASTGTWQTGAYLGATGQTNHVATNGSTLQITGVQWEKGSTASTFEFRSYQKELLLCQRYYQKYTALSGNYVAFGAGRGAGSTTVFCYFKYTTTVRATPTITQSNTGINNPSQITVTGLGSVYYGSDGAGVELTTGSTTNSGVACLWVGNNNSSAYVDVSAEL